MLKVLLLRGKKSGNASVEVMSAHFSIFLPPSPAVHPAESRSRGTILVCVGWPDRSWEQSGSLHRMQQFLRVSLQKAVLFWRVGRMQVGLCWSASMPHRSPKDLSVASGGTAKVVMNYAHLKGITHGTFHVAG